MDSAAASWGKVQALMRRECGVVLADDQSYLLDARLGPVAKDQRCASVVELVEVACSSPRSAPLFRAVIDAMTTHESLFFRDPQFWRAFEERIVPELLAQAGGRKLRIWCAACSHGQEPYSIAMLFEERWPQLAPLVELLATDVSAPAIDRARAGLYSTLEVNRGLSAGRLVRHFQQEPGGLRIKEKLRERVTWSVGNLLGAAPLPLRCDAILCRNVLIYFSEADRKSTLKRIGESLLPGGFIGLGGTETPPRPAVAPGWYRNSP